MKNLLAIIVLGLLFGWNTQAEIIELDQGIKVNIPKGYEHLQFDQLILMKENLKSMEVPKSKIDETLDQMESLGMNGSETSTVIGKKGFVKGYGDYMKHLVSGNTPESWDGMDEIAETCKNKKTEKSFIKCFVKAFEMDPVVQIDVSNGTSEVLKEISLAFNKMSGSGKKDIKDFNKSSELIKQTFSSMYQNEFKVKLVKVKNKKFGFEILGEDKMMGITAKRIGYIFSHNERLFIVQGFCMSSATCKELKKLNNKIIEPHLSRYLQN